MDFCLLNMSCVYKYFQVCNKVSITLTVKPIAILKYLRNSIYIRTLHRNVRESSSSIVLRKHCLPFLGNYYYFSEFGYVLFITPFFDCLQIFFVDFKFM
jgi:hypothetical protein